MRFISSRKTAALVAALALAVCALPAAAAGRKIERRVPPVYPELAKRMHIGGTVRVAATIAADGTVTQAKAISGNKLLESAAENAIRQWKFAPGDGTSTENINVDFEVND
ncbi:MAG TPA: energy transducer TonB [Acidobacteriaceae bacterium]|nr:energy transducer TonB [Acidobacteriaceae bacterium]